MGEQLNLRQWHAFKYGKHLYLSNAERLVSGLVDRPFLDLLGKLSKDPSTTVSSNEKKRLVELELIDLSRRQPTKSARSGDEEKAGKARDTRIVSVNLMIAQQCNMRCIYCYGDGGSYGNPSMMSEKTALKSVDWLCDQSGDARELTLTFFGGEPLLNIPLIQETVRYAEKKAGHLDKKFRYTLCTNALLLEDAFIVYLKEKAFRVLIGFDGPPLIQNRNRPLLNGGASYDRAVSRIHKVLKALPGRTFLRATLLYAGELPRVVNHMYRFNVPHFQIVFASPGLHGARSEQRAYPRTTLDNGSFFMKKTEQFISAVKSENWKEVKKLMRWSEFQAVVGMSGSRFRRPDHCGVGRKMVAVSTEGKLFPCHRFVGHADHEIGHIESRDLNRDRYVSASPILREPCSSCWVRLRCMGRCLYNNLGKTGSMWRPDGHDCQWIQARIQSSIHLEHALSEQDKNGLSRFGALPKRSCPLDF